MSTRCNIFLNDGHSTVTLYRHHDGYPSSVLPDLEELKELKPGTKSLYGSSRLAQYIVAKHHDDYQPTDGLSWDAEYVYFVNFNRDRGVYSIITKEFNFYREDDN